MRDVAQDVLEQLLKSWSKYDANIGPVERWQNRIAVFTALHYHEKSKSRPWERPGVEPDPESPDESPTALELVEDLSQRQHAHALMHQISPDLREVLTRYLAGMPMKEIASQLSLPVSTAYKRLARACEELEHLWRMAEACPTAGSRRAYAERRPAAGGTAPARDV